MKFSLQINIAQAENGFVVNANALGANKQFIATTFAQAKTVLGDFIEALEMPTDAPAAPMTFSGTAPKVVNVDV